MKKVGLALVVGGIAGFFLLPQPAWRWEAVGVAVTGLLLLLIPAPRG
jgi:hypothetical protein